MYVHHLQNMGHGRYGSTFNIRSLEQYGEQTMGIRPTTNAGDFMSYYKHQHIGIQRLIMNLQIIHRKRKIGFPIDIIDVP